MKEQLERLINKALDEMGLSLPALTSREQVGAPNFVVEHPADLSHGDYSTNVAMVLAKSLGQNPRELAESIADTLRQAQGDFISEIKVAGAGFINFHLSQEFFQKSVGGIIEKGDEYGRNASLSGQKIMVEHTDPNPFKVFHIGHLMPNVIGSTVSRILEWNGAEVKQANYQGDVGMHVAKAVWGLLNKPLTTDDAQQLAQAYSEGAKAYETDEEARKDIVDINKKIYSRSDEEVNKIYDEGRRVSLEVFEEMYKRLGVRFDFYFFESEVADRGRQIVEEYKGRVFEDSDGATVFNAEKFNPKLHTRVFLNSEGIPTYEAKELGLVPTKYEKYPYDLSVVITGNEINEYFKVLLEAMRQIFPDLAERTKHLSHGMLRLPTGKMSSRTGDVITADELIEEVKTRTEGNEAVAIAAIKYMILRQAIGGDIIFDFEKSVSTEGDSGVYLQYAYARTNSLLEKAASRGDTLGKSVDNPPQGGALGRETHAVERLLYRFPEVVERAREEYAPNYIVTYLTELASSFNNFYAHEQVISDSPESAYRLAITKAFNTVMKNGLTILGIPVLERM